MSGLRGWRPPTFAPPAAMQGRHARLERLSPDAHAAALHDANAMDDGMWRWMGYGPFPSPVAYADWVAASAASEDPLFYAIAGDGDWAGVASWLRIVPAHGSIEIGHIALAPPLRGTTTATEALHLMIDRAFEMGFRRVEWKCDAGNAASISAARRLGFAHEGTFRQHMVVKGANRDTAWFVILDGDWPRLCAAHRAWLDPSNFDARGGQRLALSRLVAGVGAPG